jgi:hypothetical protein
VALVPQTRGKGNTPKNGSVGKSKAGRTEVRPYTITEGGNTEKRDADEAWTLA